ncbi:MAG: DNA recombination/repair protein RecA [Candidatus Hodarchaeota archaeon]
MEKDKELNELMNLINKSFGEGALMPADEFKGLNIRRIPTGVYALDKEIGGGLPVGRLIELYGVEGGCKTTLAMKMVSKVQKAGKVAAWIDVEGTFDRNWAKRNGVDTSALLFSKPEKGEMAGDIIDSLVRSGKVGIIILDSVAGLIPKDDVDTSMEDRERIGARAMMVNRIVRKLQSGLNIKVGEDNIPNDTIVVFINQIRYKIGTYGNPEETTGGQGLRFHSSIRIELRKGARIKKGDDVIGLQINFKIPKNKTYPPFRTGHFNFYLNGKIDNLTSLIEYAVTYGIIEKSGNSYTFNKKKYKGKAKLAAYLQTDKKTVKLLKKQVEQAYNK